MPVSSILRIRDGSNAGADDEEEASRSALVEVTLGDLGDDLEQHFYRRLELWDRAAGKLVTESVPGEVDAKRHALVLRLCYRLRWNPDEGTGEHWVDYPKTSRPDDGIYDRARRIDRLLLPFAAITPGRPLSLRPDGKFRMLLSNAGGDLGKILDALLAAVDTATDGLSGTDGIRQILAEILEPVRPTLAIAPGDLAEHLVQFRADGRHGRRPAPRPPTGPPDGQSRRHTCRPSAWLHRRSRSWTPLRGDDRPAAARTRSSWPTTSATASTPARPSTSLENCAAAAPSCGCPPGGRRLLARSRSPRSSA